MCVCVQRAVDGLAALACTGHQIVYLAWKRSWRVLVSRFHRRFLYELRHLQKSVLARMGDTPGAECGARADAGARY